MKPDHTHLITLRAICFMIACTAAFALMNIFIRYASFELHTTQIVFLRNLFSLVLLMPWVLRHGTGVIATGRTKIHFCRAAIGLIGMQTWFYCVAVLPINEATALSFTAPILTTLFAMFFLKERAGPHRWAAVGMGFVGALIIIRPNPDNMNWLMLIVPFATAMWAIANLLVKSLTTTEPPTRIVFYMSFFMTLISAPLAIPHWQVPGFYELMLIFGIASLSTIAHLLMVRAYGLVEVVILMPFDFFRLVFTAIFAYLAFGEVASHWTWIGGAVIVASAAYIAHREALKKRTP